MPQTVSPAGYLITGNTFIFSGVGDPNVTQANVPQMLGASLGSLYLRQDGPSATSCLYVLTSAAVAGAFPSSPPVTNPVWTAK